MTRISGHLGRSVAWTSLLVAALFHVFPNLAAAEEPPTEALPASGVDTAAEVQTEATAGSDTVADMITAPAGTSAAPAQAAAAIDSVQESMAKIHLQAASGVGDAYVLEFGDSFDWVQLVSGEWIKGNIARMRNDKVEFDSDKLDMLYLDFADVSLVHSPQVNTYVFDDGASATGPAVITAEQVIVQTDEGTKTFPRSELESIVEGEKERDWWSMKLRFGLTLNRGNTNQLTYDIKFNTRREDRLTLLDLNYNATFGKTNGVQNVNRQLG
ncbi:MAG: hypothetical protein WBN15_01305, partial [Polyangiales bacterium]